MARHYSRKNDGNQKQIVKELRAMRYRVGIISRAGGGVPDLVVAGPCYGVHANSFLEAQVLVEVKQPGEGYTDAEDKFLADWPVTLWIRAETTEDVLFWFGIL